MTTLNPKLLGLVAAYQAQCDIRYYLTRVHIRPHPHHMPGALIVATNGHQLAMAYDASAQVEREALIVVTDAAQKACLARHAKVAAIRDGRLCVDTERPRCNLEEAYVQPGPVLAPPDWLSGFPVYDGMLPADPSELRPRTIATLAAEKVMALATTAKRLDPQCVLHHYTLTAAGQGSTGAVFTRFSSEPNLLVITMPMDAPEPDWLPAFSGLAHAGRARRAARSVSYATVERLKRRAESEVNRDA